MLPQLSLQLADESETIALAQAIANSVTSMKQNDSCFKLLTIYLTGELGAGKTTFSRGVIQALGHKGHVKSPTYALVESYKLTTINVHHFDLYRLASPEELEYIGIREFFDNDTLLLIEWPEKGANQLIAPELTIQLSYHNMERIAHLTAMSERTQLLLTELEKHHK